MNLIYYLIFKDWMVGSMYVCPWKLTLKCCIYLEISGDALNQSGGKPGQLKSLDDGNIRFLEMCLFD